MTDDRDTTPDHHNEPDDSVDNKLNSLLPAPGKSRGEPEEHGQVDGPIDELLPIPGEADTSNDDASTREELEVDTTADGVDDFIPLHDVGESSDQTGDPDDEVQQKNDAPPAKCLACGKEIGDVRFCPTCGTEQVPASRFVARLAPLFMWSRPLPIRVALSVGFLLTLFFLLIDNGTAALIIGASIVPIVLLIRLAEEMGGLNSNGWVQVGMMVLIGAAVGLPISWLANRLVVRFWFEGGVVNFGATIFGGTAVGTVGAAPFIIWLTCGILLPLIVVLAIGFAPVALRVAIDAPPREQTGMILSAGVAGGYLIGAAAVFYWPLFSELPPIMSTSEWTLTILGVGVLRPLVWVFSGAMIGAVVWRYFRNASLPGLAVPAAMAIGLPIGYSLLGLAFAPAGLWASSIISILFAAVAIWLHTRFVDTATSHDAKLQAL